MFHSRSKQIDFWGAANVEPIDMISGNYKVDNDDDDDLGDNKRSLSISPL